jgi:hypothetical protein
MTINTGKAKPKPPTPEQAQRQARLAAELRANLKKRKALAREKASDVSDKD